MKKLTLTFILPLLLFALLAPAFAAPVVHETPAVSAVEQGEFVLTATAPDGSVLWEEQIRNAFADEGEQLILDVFLRGATAPTQFYLRLYNDTPVETDGLASLTGEPSGNGYAPALIERSATGWPTLALDSGDYQATSKAVTFTASGGSIGPVTYAVIATSSDNTLKLIAYAALSQSRTLADGESLTVTYRLKQQ